MPAKERYLELLGFSLSPASFALVCLVALFIGMSKTGVHGTGMVAVPLLASVFGGKLSSGVMLPMLCLADIIGVWYYHRHASWKHLRTLFPWAALGTVAGTLVGEVIDDNLFRMIMAVVIIGSLAIMIWLERGRKEEVPDSKFFSGLTGVAGGFTSMVGNLAGSVMAVYFLSMRLPKNSFIGTTAWFFLVVNLFKVPFHVFRWNTISFNTFLFDLMLLPLLALGAWLGIIIVRNIPETLYRWFIIGMTLIAAVMMFL